MTSHDEMLEHRPIFTSGYNCMLHVHTIEEEVQCAALLKAQASARYDACGEPTHSQYF